MFLLYISLVNNQWQRVIFFWMIPIFELIRFFIMSCLPSNNYLRILVKNYIIYVWYIYDNPIGSADFFGLNHYTTTLMFNDPAQTHGLGVSQGEAKYWNLGTKICERSFVALSTRKLRLGQNLFIHSYHCRSINRCPSWGLHVLRTRGQVLTIHELKLHLRFFRSHIWRRLSLK